jgi:hypothetical protein
LSHFAVTETLIREKNVMMATTLTVTAARLSAPLSHFAVTETSIREKNVMMATTLTGMAVQRSASWNWNSLQTLPV